MHQASYNKTPVTVDTLLREYTRALRPVSPTPRLDAEVLIMHVCGIDRSYLITYANSQLTDNQRKWLDALIGRRQHGEPVAYLIGEREFWSMMFDVTPATLIPRPTTELLVEKALARIPSDAAWTIADLGTGCGTIALTLAKERPRCQFIATDISETALIVARENVKKFNLRNIELRTGDWFVPLSGEKLEMIVSNPPYVRSNDPCLRQDGISFEPLHALVAGPEGLDAIGTLVAQARRYLNDGGRFIIEHGPEETTIIVGLLHRNGYRDIVCHRDMDGMHRVTECAP